MASAPQATPPQAKPDRIESLDAFRGFTILGMVFVIAVAAGQYQHEAYRDTYGGLPQQMRWFGSPPVSTWFHAEVGWELWKEHFEDEHLAAQGLDRHSIQTLSPEERGAIEYELKVAELGHEYAHLKNIGCNFTDLIAPWFVFIVGACIPLSRKRRGGAFWGHALSRTALLVIMGMIYISLVIKQTSFWWGVLQAIGIAYLCGVLVCRLPSPARWLAVFVAGFGNLLLTETLPMWTMRPEHWPLGTQIDSWREIARPFWTLTDPTGSQKRVLTIHCLPWLSISYGVMTMIGVLLGEALLTRNAKKIAMRCLVLAAIFMTLGYGIHRLGFATENWSLCMNKPDVTTSYAFFTSGFGALVFLLFYGIIDVLKIRFWAKPLNVFGVNPLLAYFMMIVLRRALEALGLVGAFNRVFPGRPQWDNPLVHNWAVFFGQTDPNNSWVFNLFRKSGYHGVLWGLIYTFLLWLIVLWFNRRKIFWKL